MKYYAEFETDRVIRESFFSDFSFKGIFVEVGGASPEFLSMSKHFKESGWRTLVVEPNPHFAQLHREAGNEVVECACSSENSPSERFTIVTQNVLAYGGVVTDHAFSSLCVKEDYRNILPNTAQTKEITVSVRKLQDVLEEKNLNKIDVLSIDVEGWEIEVMKGLDNIKTDCKIIVLENLFHRSEYTEYMNSVGFSLFCRVDYNYIYKKT